MVSLSGRGQNVLFGEAIAPSHCERDRASLYIVGIWGLCLLSGFQGTALGQGVRGKAL